MRVDLRAVEKCEAGIHEVLAKPRGKGNKSERKSNDEVCGLCMSGREKKRDAPTCSDPNFE
jgi:hypothetical protein